MLSKYGVCYDLNVSPYRSIQNGIVFVFSSELHLNKFESKLKENRDTINYSLTKRFNMNVDVSTLADVILYRKIESRGFLIEAEEEIRCQKDIRLSGVKVTTKKSKR